jgi:hypothetical protein
MSYGGYNVPPQGGSVFVYPWIPNDGELNITLSGNQAVNALYLSLVDTNISFSAFPTPENGNPFYTAHPPTDGSNPQTVNTPTGTTTVTLSAASSGMHYVFAYTGNYRPSMSGPAK